MSSSSSLLLRPALAHPKEYHTATLSRRDVEEEKDHSASSRIRRYRPGEAPEWIHDLEEEEDEYQVQATGHEYNDSVEVGVDDSIGQDERYVSTGDRRLDRLMRDGERNRDRALERRRRRIEEAEVITVNRRHEREDGSASVPSVQRIKITDEESTKSHSTQQQRSAGRDLDDHTGKVDDNDSDDDDDVRRRHQRALEKRRERQLSGTTELSTVLDHRSVPILSAPSVNRSSASVLKLSSHPKNRVDVSRDSDEESDDEEADDEEEEDEYEYESDSSEDNFRLKPVFVPKSSRITVAEKEKLIEEQNAMEREREKRAQARKRESHQMVVAEVRRETEAENRANMSSSDEDLPDTDDDADEAQEYESWKQRELGRVKREKDEQEQYLQELVDRERRRNMDDDEVMRENRELESRSNIEKKVRWNFLQKYYHKGVFFVETQERGVVKEDLYARDYGEATGEDKFDKSLLPKIMQVKNFGRRGRVKWTHLVNEDTTDFSAAWAQKGYSTRSVSGQREIVAAGVKPIFDRKDLNEPAKATALYSAVPPRK